MAGNVYAKYCKRINQEMRSLFFKYKQYKIYTIQDLKIFKNLENPI